MLSQELISVIIPTYKNRGKLKSSIDSVLAQDYVNVEIIVVDDNDPLSEWRKNTEYLMQLYADNVRIIYIRHEQNKNGAAARNTGIKASHGKFIAFLDDDDTFLPMKLSRQIEFLHENPQFDAAYCFAKREENIIDTIPFEGDVSREILLLNSNLFTPTLIFRRQALIDINGFDESFFRHQDYELLLKFFNKGYRIGCVKEILTILGANQGENIPEGRKIEEIKANFFKKFDPYIYNLDKVEKGFRNKVYARHYGTVCINHIKHLHLLMAIRIIGRYMYMSPKDFLSMIWQTIKSHIQ